MGKPWAHASWLRRACSIPCIRADAPPDNLTADHDPPKERRIRFLVGLRRLSRQFPGGKRLNDADVCTGRRSVLFWLASSNVGGAVLVRGLRARGVVVLPRQGSRRTHASDHRSYSRHPAHSGRGRWRDPAGYLRHRLSLWLRDICTLRPVLTPWVTAPDGTARPSSSYGNPFAWTGQRYDPAVRLYHVWARSYSPALGRWLQRDPLGYVDGVGLYEYVGAQATEMVDPLGLAPIHLRQSAASRTSAGGSWHHLHRSQLLGPGQATTRDSTIGLPGTSGCRITVMTGCSRTTLPANWCAAPLLCLQRSTRPRQPLWRP